LLIGATICYFHSFEKIRPEMWIIIDLMKKTLEEYSCRKTIIKTNDIIFILSSLKVVARYDDNSKHLLELGFSSLLLKIVCDHNFTIVQYAVLLFGSLSIFFSSKDAKQLVSANAFNIFSDLFKRLTFTTSTIPFFSFRYALLIVREILLNEPSSVELFMSTPLIQTIINMLPPFPLLVVYTPLSFQMECVIDYIGNILDCCSDSVKNIKKLFNLDGIILYLLIFEMIAKEREKGKIEFDTILRRISVVFNNWAINARF
jgi:hypothetical protein